jgi:hypothetical protein
MRRDAPLRRPLPSTNKKNDRPVIKKAGKHRDFWTPNKQDIENVRNSSASRFDRPFKGAFLKSKSGDNTIRLLPPTWRNPKYFAMEVFQHRYIGPEGGNYLCLNKMRNERCPICEAWREAVARGDQQASQKLSPKQRWVALVLHRDSETPEEPVIWDFWRDINDELLIRMEDRKTREMLPVSHPYEGYDLTFRKSGSGQFGTKYTGFEFDRDPSPLLDDSDKVEEILQQLEDNPLDARMRFFDADHLEKVLFGTAEAKDADLEDEEEEEETPPFEAAETEEEETEEEEQSEDEDEDAEEAEAEEEEESEDEDDEPDVSTRRPPPPKQERRQVPRIARNRR